MDAGKFVLVDKAVTDKKMYFTGKTEKDGKPITSEKLKDAKVYNGRYWADKDRVIVNDVDYKLHIEEVD